jgi:two-component system chemotaxis response regulator CheY
VFERGRQVDGVSYMSILMAEDNAVSSKLMQMNIEKLGYASIVAKNGLEAIEKLKTSNNIRLVITDILMPDMDGLTLFQTIKSTPLFQNIPIIICSSLSDAPSIKKAASLGCRHYLLKPVSFEELKRKISEALSEGKRIIKSKAEIIRENRLKEDSFDDLASTFRVLLEEQRAALESGQAAINDTALLRNLYEPARVFGTEGLLSSLDKLRVNLHSNIHDASIKDLIIREIHTVINHLSPDHTTRQGDNE